MRVRVPPPSLAAPYALSFNTFGFCGETCCCSFPLSIPRHLGIAGLTLDGGAEQITSPRYKRPTAGSQGCHCSCGNFWG